MSKPRTSPETVFIVAILVGAIGLLQVHAIAFWQAHVGTMGFAWSILLEATALWLWYQPRFSIRALALTASLLMLLGPVHHVSEPLLAELGATPHRDAARENRIDALKDERALVIESLEVFRDNSTQRSGWLPAIETNQQRLQAINNELAELIAQPPESPLRWRGKTIIVMQVLALMIFQITAVLAITTLSRRMREATRTPSEDAAAPPQSVELPPAARRESTPSTDAPRETPQSEITEPQPEPAAPSAALSIEAILPPERVDLPEQTTLPEARHDPEAAESAALDPYAKGRFGLGDIQRIRAELDAYLAREDMSQGAFCRKYAVTPRNLSFLRRHEARTDEGERTISEAALEELEAILKTSTTEEAV